MSNYGQKSGNRPPQRGRDDCGPDSETAEHPHHPGKDCEAFDDPPPPTVSEPERCKKPEGCECPEEPTSTSNCLEDMIAAQQAEITKAAKAETFKKELEGLLTGATKAVTTYNPKNFAELLKNWEEADGEIVTAIDRVVCNTKCWRCVIECHICPLLNEMHYAEAWLNGDGSLPDKAGNLQDLRYWHQRDVEVKRQRFERIKAVLAGWADPKDTIGKVIADNRNIVKNVHCAPAGEALVNLFLRVIPLHLAVAPPQGATPQTKIPKEYTEICGCDTGTRDDCCGPDVGVWSLRQRLIFAPPTPIPVGALPYLIDPKDYFKVICCLVEKRYGPAKDALADAEVALQGVDERIRRNQALIANGLKDFAKNATGAIPGDIECRDYEPCNDDDDARPSQSY